MSYRVAVVQRHVRMIDRRASPSVQYTGLSASCSRTEKSSIRQILVDNLPGEIAPPQITPYRKTHVIVITIIHCIL